MIRRRFAIPVIALAILVAALAAYAQLAEGTKAPTFKLPTIDGKTFVLADCYKKPNKVVVLDMWATFCPPCRKEIPHLISLYNKYKSKGAVFVGVSVDRDINVVKDFVKQNKITYTIAFDKSGQVTGAAYKLRYIPSTYIIDSKGVIRRAFVGFDESKHVAMIESEIKKLIAEK